jgi:ABC-type multidrug transport system fused ATPase/permease subunit
MGSKPTMETEGQNLINPSNIIVSSRAPRAPIYKAFAVDVVAVLSAIFFGYAYYAYLTRGFSVWLLLAAFTLFGVLAALQVFLVKRTGQTLFVILLESIGVVGFFWADNWRILLITWAVVLVFLVWGYFSGRNRLMNSIDIPFFGTSGTTLGKFTTGLLIFMVLIYAPQMSGNPLVVSQKSFRSFFNWAASVANGFYPGVSLTGSFGNFSESFTKMELQNNPSFNNLTQDQQSAAIAQGTQQFEQDFLGNVSSTVATSSPASDAFYNVLQGMMNAWQTESGGWFVVGWAAVIFIALRSVGVVFIWLAEFVTLMFYELLLATGFMKITEEEHIREVIGY